MSVIKLMSRIKAPSHLEENESEHLSENLHDHTYGITSDPLTQFACAFSALIHEYVDSQAVDLLFNTNAHRVFSSFIFLAIIVWITLGFRMPSS